MKTVKRTIQFVLIASLIPTVALAAKPAPKGGVSVQQMNKEVMIQQAPAEVKQELVAPVVKPEPAPNKVAPHKIEAMQKPANVPAVTPEMMKQPPTQQALPAVQQQKVTAPPAAIRKAPSNKFENANAVRQADQARGVRESKDAMEALRNVQGMPERGQNINPDLGLGGKGGLTGPGGRQMDLSKLPGHDTGGYGKPAGAEYLPDLPSNQDKGPSSAALRPSGNLRGAMSGAASTGGPPPAAFFNEYAPVPTGQLGNETTPGMAGAFRSSLWRNRATGEQRVVHQDEWGNVIGFDSKVQVGDSYRTTHMRQDRMVEVVVDGAGRVTKYVDGEEVPMPPQTGVDKLMDPNSENYSPEFAAWARQFDHSAKKGAPEINKVNPGPNGATPNPQAPRIVPGENQLVINPDPNNVSGQGALPDAAEYRQRLRDKVKGPGGHPGDDPEVNVPK